MLLFLIRTAWCAEDAYIAFRVVDNFLSGQGLTWNVGYRVQVYTDPLFEFLTITATLITHDPYWSSMVISLLLSLAMYCVLMHGRPVLTVLMGTTILLTGKGFMDFSVSGLENPATHLAIVAYLFVYWKKRDPFWLTLIASLAAVNRMDSLLLFVPSLLITYYRSGWQVWKPALLGSAPFLAWEAFSIFYYGFPFPNTAYAKLRTGIPSSELLRQGVYYLQNTISWDKVSALTIVGGLAVGFSSEDWPLASGGLLSVLYVVRVGGDYMSGRFLTPVFVLACALLIQHAPRKKWQAIVLTAAALLFGMLIPRPTLLTTKDFGGPEIDLDHGVTDERFVFYRATGLLRWRKGIVWPDIPWVQNALELRRSGAHYAELLNDGIIPYLAGPQVYVYDSGALGDALTARLPMTPGEWRIGHFWRDPPPGYLETLKTGTNHIRDPELSEYYEHLNRIIHDSLWEPARWKDIVFMNLGSYNHLLHNFSQRLKK